MTAAFTALRPDQLSDATPQMNVLQRVGGAIGTAVLAVVLQRAGAHAHTPAQLASAFDAAYWWSLGIALLSLIPCLVLLRAENPRAKLTREAADAEAAVEPLGVSRARSSHAAPSSRSSASPSLRAATRRAAGAAASSAEPS